MKTNQLIGLGCLMIATTVALGAMGAHTLEGSISPRYLEVWKTASLYFALNGLGLLAIANIAPTIKGLYIKLIIILNFFNIITFFYQLIFHINFNTI